MRYNDDIAATDFFAHRLHAERPACTTWGISGAGFNPQDGLVPPNSST